MDRIFFLSLDGTQGAEGSGGGPRGFADLFPIASITSGGVILSGQADCAAGVLLGSAQGGMARASRAAAEASSWLVNLAGHESLLSGYTVSVSVYAPCGGDGEGAESMGLLVALVVSQSSGGYPLIHNRGDDQSRSARLGRSAELADDLAGNLSASLRKGKIIARRIDSAVAAARASKSFWLNRDQDAPQSQGSPKAFYADRLAIKEGRTFWLDGESIKMMFLQTAPPLIGTAASLEPLSRVTEFPNSAPAGLHFLCLTRHFQTPNVAALGGATEERKDKNGIVSRIWRATARAVTRKTKTITTVSVQPSGKSIAVCRGAILEESKSGKETFAGWDQAKAVSKLEWAWTKSLWQSFSGAEWSCVDSTWLEALYMMVPGAMRLGETDGSGAFDRVIFQIDDSIDQTVAGSSQQSAVAE